MTTREHIQINDSLIEISESAFEKGQELVKGLTLVQRALGNAALMQTGQVSFSFMPDSHYMAVVPQAPIERELIAHEYNKDDRVLLKDETAKPFRVTRFEIIGLSNLGPTADEDILVVGSCPPELKLGEGIDYTKTYQYTFDLRKHQIAIVSSG